MNVKNQKCIRKLSRRSLRMSRRRNVIAIIAIALTTLLFTSLFTVAMSINSSYEMYTFRQIGGYCHGTFKDVTEEQALEIAAHSSVKAVGKRISIGYMDGGDFAKTSAEVSFMDENCTRWSFAEPSTGRNPQTGKEIAMDDLALKLLGVEPELGAEIELTCTAGALSQNPYEKTDTFTLVGWWAYDDLCPVHYINVSEEYAKQVEAEAVSRGMERFRIDLNVMMVSGMDIRGQMEQVDMDLGYCWDETGDGELVRIGVNWGYTSAQMMEALDATAVVAAAAFLILVSLTGYLIIYNIFHISVTGDIQFYGLLKTIGVTPRQLRRIIRQQALLLCAVGIPLGLLTGYGVGAVLTPVILARTTLGVEVADISTSPLIFFGSALFALVTVLLSCFRPGRIAAGVSPVEATRYTEENRSRKKRRQTRGAKVYQMALANLGRNTGKTVLVVISLALSVVLFNILVTFTNGFDMEKYLEQNTCGDFIVSTADYFRYRSSANYISQQQIEQIKANTTESLSGCGYQVLGAKGWMTEEAWRAEIARYGLSDTEGTETPSQSGELVSADAQIEGLDEGLFEKLTVVEGDLGPLFREDGNAIAVVVYTDDYGNVSGQDHYPDIGSSQIITYVDDDCYIDSRTGEISDENTPQEFLEHCIVQSHDVEYTVCAYVTVPYSMSYRYSSPGYSFVLTADSLAEDSREDPVPVFYLFDTPDTAAEETAERYLDQLTADDRSGLMYESKATVRAEFEDFQKMFLLLGGLLCAIIGIVGVLNFFNAVMTGILSRKRELAVLQAVGMTNRQLRSMLVYEGQFYALGSGLMAVAVSAVLNPLVSRLMEDMFWFFSGSFTIIPAVVTIPVFALLGWGIPTVMYDSAGKRSIIEQLRDV